MKYVRLYDCGRQVVLMMNVGLEMGGPTGPTGVVDGLDELSFHLQCCLSMMTAC